MAHSLDHDVARWMKAIRPYLRKPPAPDPSTSALLVVDMQEHFSGIAAAIVDRVRSVVRGSRKLGVPVLFTQHGHANPEVDGGMLGQWWRTLIVEGTVDHRLIDGIGRDPKDPVMAKRRYSAFHDTDLEALLGRLGVRDLAVAGVMTNLCVETTARDAFVRDFRVRVLADATATATEEMHVASLLNLAFGFAFVQTTEEWIASLTHREAGSEPG